YLFGYLFSMGVYAQREQRGQAFFPDYLRLLRATGSASAEDLAREHLQVDLAKPDFWQASVDIARARIEAFEKLLLEENGRG
ncbi:MAG: oligoendopeptidase, partial [Halioglobus sp.]|nr:oligoendopeptidase [Halioglobus sp.]